MLFFKRSEKTLFSKAIPFTYKGKETINVTIEGYDKEAVDYLVEKIKKCLDKSEDSDDKFYNFLLKFFGK